MALVSLLLIPYVSLEGARCSTSISRGSWCCGSAFWSRAVSGAPLIHPSPLPSRHPNAKCHVPSSRAPPTIVPSVGVRIPRRSGATCANLVFWRGVNARAHAASAKRFAPQVTPVPVLTATTSATPTQLFMPSSVMASAARTASNGFVVKPAANAFPVGAALPCIVSALPPFRLPKSSWPSTWA
jgi:hypothetical protein